MEGKPHKKSGKKHKKKEKDGGADGGGSSQVQKQRTGGRILSKFNQSSFFMQNFNVESYEQELDDDLKKVHQAE